MKTQRLLSRLSPLAAALAVASTLAAAGGVPAAPAQDAPAAGLDLLGTLSALRAGPTLRVERAAERLTLVDVATGDVVLVATPAGLTQVGTALVQRPAPGEPAQTRVVRDRAGAVAYTVSVTARGGHMLVVEPGVLGDHAPGYTFLAFDNDDYSITARTPADGPAQTRLVASQHTAYDGTLTQREGAAFGCGCERRVSPDGRVTIQPR